MRFMVLVLACSGVLVSCNSHDKKNASGFPPVQVNLASGRGPASEEATIRYYTWRPAKAGGPSVGDVDTITPQRWRAMSTGARFDLVSKIWASNTRERSRRGLRHATCFTGHASDIRDLFFNSSGQTKLEYVEGGVPKVNTSDDEMMLSLRYTAQLPQMAAVKAFVRIPNCGSGKGEYGPTLAKEKLTYFDPKKTKDWYVTDSKRTPARDDEEDPFGLEDKPPANAPAQLPRFQLKADFDKLASLNISDEKDRPWKGMDISHPKGAYEFAVLVQKYAYEGMFKGGDAKPNDNLIAQSNEDRYWCNMPYLGVGDSGREWIHGLTKERDLRPSEHMKLYRTAPSGSDWGVAYYNAYGCKTIAKIFGSPQSPKNPPNFNVSNAQFEDGTMTAKFLFTTAMFPTVRESFKWDANVSIPGSNDRKPMKVNHIQMDIAVRDSSLVGVNRELNDWVMVTYYFDPAFNYKIEYTNMTGSAQNPLDDVKNLPLGFKKMRPQGLAVGFDSPEKATGDIAKYLEFTGASTIFKGAQTNEPTGRLNGPADNPKSACLNCHAAAGTRVPMAPGVVNLATWRQVRGQALDFSQQVALAKRNAQTR